MLLLAFFLKQIKKKEESTFKDEILLKRAYNRTTENPTFKS